MSPGGLAGAIYKKRLARQTGYESKDLKINSNFNPIFIYINYHNFYLINVCDHLTSIRVINWPGTFLLCMIIPIISIILILIVVRDKKKAGLLSLFGFFFGIATFIQYFYYYQLGLSDNIFKVNFNLIFFEFILLPFYVVSYYLILKNKYTEEMKNGLLILTIIFFFDFVVVNLLL